MRVTLYKSIVSLILVSTMVISDYANAQAQVVVAGYTARLNLAIGRLVTAKMARWGIAANDPRIAATVKGIETGLTVVAGVGIVGGTTVSWPALLLAAGLAGVAGGGLKLATDKNFTWSFSSDGKVTATGSIPGSLGPLPTPSRSFLDAPAAMVQNAQVGLYSYPVWNAALQKDVYSRVYSTDLYLLGSVMMNHQYASNPTAVLESCGNSNNGMRPVISESSKTCIVRTMSGDRYYWNTVYFSVVPAPVSSSSGHYDDRIPPAGQNINSTYIGSKEAVEAMPNVMKGELLSPEALAASVNAAWKAATDPNSTGGIPWSASDPVTPGDASAWIGSNASSAPTVADFVAPANHVSGNPGVSIGSPPSPSTGGGTSPGTGVPVTPNPGTGGETSPETQPETAPVTPGEGTKIDWGPNPNIGAPMIEATPTVSSILDPIFNVMPDLKNFGVPNHASVCPTASFDLYGQNYLLNVHCGLIEQNRQVIAACALLCFSLASLFIVLRA